MGYSGVDVICFIETNTPAVIKLAVLMSCQSWINRIFNRLDSTSHSMYAKEIGG